MTKPKQDKAPLKINLAPDDALSRAMMVKPPKDWRKALAQKKSR